MKDTGINIEHGIPVTKRYKYGNVYETIRKMKVGDSFVYPKTLRNTAHCAARRLKIVITTRAVEDKTVRVWRLE